MKVKSLLKLSSAVKVNILVTDEDGTIHDHDIDFTRGILTPEKMSEHWTRYGTTNAVPWEILNSDISLVSTNDTNGALKIYTKKGVTNG